MSRPPLSPWSNDSAEPWVTRRSRELRRPLRTHQGAATRRASMAYLIWDAPVSRDGAASVLPLRTWTSVLFFVTMRVRLTPKWACSAVGSAPEWHSGGHRFDPGQVHQPSLSCHAKVAHRSSREFARADVDLPLRILSYGWQATCRVLAQIVHGSSPPRQSVRASMPDATGTGHSARSGRASGRHVCGRFESSHPLFSLPYA